MKRSLLVWTVLAVLMATWATAFACKDRQAGASAGMTGCSAHNKSAAMAAGMDCAHEKNAMAGGMCSHEGAAFMSAGMPGCAHGKSADAAMMGCSGHDKAMGAMSADMDCAHCASCVDMADCEKELESAGAVIQVVRLKNGVMYVYTAAAPGKVRTVQAALAKRGDEWSRLAVAGNTARLCPPCKEMRGAAASGKLSRETVNIEGGCLTLMTSTDPGVVKKIYAMAGISNGNRAKS